MKKSIWKFPLQTTDSQLVSMPKDAEILTVQTQNDIPCIWAFVNPDFKNMGASFMEDRVIEIFGTGHTIWHENEERRTYIGTYQLHGGSLVFHVFENVNPTL